MTKLKHLLTLFTVSCLCLTASCKNKQEIKVVDRSGLSDTVLDTPIVIGKEVSREDIDKLRKGSIFYQEKLSKVSTKTTDEWMKSIDGLKEGMTQEQVVKVLPRNSAVVSKLWSYNGIRAQDIRQTMIWAVDAKHAVAVQINNEGDLAWDLDGKPSPRTMRYSNRLVRRPLLMLHDNQPDEYGSINSDKCRLR